MSRCTGHCCKKFFLPYDPQGLQELKQRILKNDLIGKVDTDNLMVIDMVIPLGPLNGLDVNGDPINRSTTKTEGYYYTCKNYKDGNCTVYETRPYVCSDYPYSELCRYKTCTWDPDDQMRTVFPEEKRPLRLFDDPVDKLKILLRRVQDRSISIDRDKLSRTFKITKPLTVKS